MEKVIAHGVAADGSAVPIQVNSDGKVDTSPSTPTPTVPSYGQKTIGTNATEIVASNANRRAVVIVNHGDSDVFIGGSDVTTSNGLLLAGTKGTGLTLTNKETVYGIVAASTQVVSFVEENES